MSALHARFPRYSKLLSLYPAGYRAEYGEQMLQTLADMLDDPDHSKLTVWARTALDFPLSVFRQRAIYTGESLVYMPPYMKRNALLGTGLVTPFFVFITLNAILNQRLYDSLVWHPNMLFVWLIVLPGIAIVLNVLALLRWVQTRRKETNATLWKVLTDFKHNWPVISVAIIGLGILALVFGHDSVQCIGGNPFQELANWHTTLRCIQQR